MNILIMTNIFPPIITGSAHYTEDLAMTLHRRGHKITVLTVQLAGGEKEYKNYPFEVVRLPSLYLKLGGIDWYTLASHNPMNYFRVARIIKRNKIDLVHQVNHYTDTVIITRTVCKLMKIPYIVSIHTQLQFRPKIYTPILKFLDKIVPGHFILKSASKIIALDSEILRYLKKTYGKWLNSLENNDKVVIIPHGIVIDASRFPAKTNYELSSLIISVGHVIDIRNRFTLIKAMKLVVNEFPNIRLGITGHVYTDRPLKIVKQL